MAQRKKPSAPVQKVSDEVAIPSPVIDETNYELATDTDSPPVDAEQSAEDEPVAPVVTEDAPPVAEPPLAEETLIMTAPIDVIVQKYSFDIDSLPEPLNQVNLALESAKTLLESDDPDRRSSGSSQLERSYRTALKQDGTIANACLDLISQYFIDFRYGSFGPLKVNSARRMPLTSKPIPPSQFMLLLNRLFLALSQANKQIVKGQVDLDRLLNSLGSEQARRTLSSYMAR